LSGYRIGTAFVGVAGRHIASLNSRGVVAVARSDHEITRNDIPAQSRRPRRWPSRLSARLST
jgi:cell division ATPase FtsA